MFLFAVDSVRPGKIDDNDMIWTPNPIPPFLVEMLAHSPPIMSRMCGLKTTFN